MSLVNLSGVEASQSFELLPDGTYHFICDKSVIKHTKAGTGKFIEIELRCVEKEFEKRRVWARFNIENKSSEAERIGKAQLKSFLQCAGLDGESLEDVEELIGLEVKAKISSEQTPPYDPQNVVKGFLPAATTAVTEKTAVKKASDKDLGF